MKGSIKLLQYEIRMGSFKMSMDGKFKQDFIELMLEDPLSWNNPSVENVIDSIKRDLAVINRTLSLNKNYYKLMNNLKCLNGILFKISDLGHCNVKVYTRLTDPWESGDSIAD